MQKSLVVLLKEKGASLVGFADLYEIQNELRKGFPFGISIAVALNRQVIEGIANGPTKQYFAEYSRVNNLLNELSKFTLDFLNKHDKTGHAFLATNADIDPITHSTKLPHKTIATRAGIGWIGKTALLVTKEFGSAVRITTVLTDAVFNCGQPIDNSECGECMECVSSCPGKAATGQNWAKTTFRDIFFNPHSCRKAARNLAQKQNIDETICGICIAVCPWTKAYLKNTKV